MSSAYWLLVRGLGDRPLSHEVGRHQLRGHSSTRRPSVQLGDAAVCYAAVWRVIFAVVDVVSHPENDPGRDRWRWRFQIRPRLALADLRDAPPVEAAGVLPRSLGRHSYIRLTEEQFDAARQAIEDVLAEGAPGADPGEVSGSEPQSPPAARRL